MSQLKEQLALFWKAVLKDPFPYWLGGILLGFLNVVHFMNMKSPWGITSYFTHWGAWIAQKFGAAPEAWVYYAGNAKQLQELEGGFLRNGGSWLDLGIVAGAFVAALLASQFRIKKIRSWKQAMGGIAGGLLMGYGARIAFGCNIGAFFSGIGSMSLHGWVYAVFIFVGAYIGSKILTRYLI
ncbi:MAG: YeeE/YedE thiosulfate transporter family protein [Bacillota bacterium]|jgi:uncharacterized membrane protein YedE/YeeE